MRTSTGKIIVKLKPKPKLGLKPVIPDDPWLDQHHRHALMSIKESWTEVTHKIQLPLGTWWDLDILLACFAEQLNMSSMSNPAPQWPYNPFTRQPFTPQELSQLDTHLQQNKLDSNCVLREFLSYLKINPNATQFQLQFIKDFLPYLSQKYRFRIINQKDSQDNYLGYWTPLNDPLSLFEQRYQILIKLPSHITDPRTDRLVELPNYRACKKSLDQLPKESISFLLSTFF